MERRPRIPGALLGLVFGLVTACGGNATNPLSAASDPAASGVRAHAASPAATAQAGVISGRLSFPSEFLPAQAIYAISAGGNSYYRVETVSYQARYRILGVRPGKYFVYSTRLPLYPGSTDVMHFGAGYTKAVSCGLSSDCTDHTPIPVQVRPTETTSGIDVTDWYEPENYFPLIPDAGGYVEIFPPKTFPTAEAAARSLVATRLIVRVEEHDDCPVNVACFRFIEIHTGHDAAYYLALAGSNQEQLRCGLYVVKDPSAWRTLDARCTSDPTAFPALDATGQVMLGMGETGCVRVHAVPGISARVVACLKAGTTVTVDDGPYFLPTAASKAPNGPAAIDLWWHIAGRGWMVHQYLGA